MELLTKLFVFALFCITLAVGVVIPFIINWFIERYQIIRQANLRRQPIPESPVGPSSERPRHHLVDEHTSPRQRYYRSLSTPNLRRSETLEQASVSYNTYQTSPSAAVGLGELQHRSHLNRGALLATRIHHQYSSPEDKLTRNTHQYSSARPPIAPVPSNCQNTRRQLAPLVPTNSVFLLDQSQNFGYTGVEQPGAREGSGLRINTETGELTGEIQVEGPTFRKQERVRPPSRTSAHLGFREKKTREEKARAARKEKFSAEQRQIPERRQIPSVFEFETTPSTFETAPAAAPAQPERPLRLDSGWNCVHCGKKEHLVPCRPVPTDNAWVVANQQVREQTARQGRI